MREALRLGMIVVPYESIPDCIPHRDTASACQNLRERGQAQNLFDKIFRNDPTAKVFVHAGYGHIDKKGNKDWIPMARYFRELSAINPFCIDQTGMTERSDRLHENPEYREAVDVLQISSPTVFIQNNGELWRQSFFQESYDAQVFHPRTNVVDGRPDWAVVAEIRKKYVPTKVSCRGHTPCLIQAFYSSEEEGRIPIDHYEETTGTLKPLFLPKGEFVIRAADVDRQYAGRD